jgi:poly-gamma-glutamate system protein
VKIESIRHFFAAPDTAPKLRCSYRSLAIAALVLLALLCGLEGYAFWRAPAASEVELLAEAAMREGMGVVRDFRASLDIALDPALDPNGTGLIGCEYSDLTTTVGSLTSKRTSSNPAFAGLITRWLKQAGVRPGDRVALNFSGSFPALNIAALAACRALGLRPVIISSVGSSTYGANIPEFTWLDMESALNRTGVFPYRSRAIALGGVAETGGGVDGQGMRLGREAMERHGALILEEGPLHDVLEHDILRRMAVFEKEGPVAAVINVGGSLQAIGWVPEAARLNNGLLRGVPATGSPSRGFIFRYAERGVPVIHLLNIERLAGRHALPVDPIPLPDAPAMQEEKERRLHRLMVSALLLSLWCSAALLGTRAEIR